MAPLRPLLAAAVFTAVAATAQAADGSGQALFEKRRALEMRSHAGRIQILQEADSCIRAAADLRSYRACEDREQAAREALRAELRPELEALRSEWQALRAARAPGP